MPAMRSSYQAEMFDSVPMQNLLSYFEQEKIIDTALREIDEKISQDPKAKRYLNIIDRRAQLIRELDENHRRRDTEIKKILANAGLKKQLRDFPQRTLQLINTQKELAAELSEEEISEEDVERLKNNINHELGLLCSEALREIYTQDVQAILASGISVLVLAYLGNLSQLYKEIGEEVEDKVADFYIQTAELQIMQSALAASKLSSVIVATENLNESKLSNEEVSGDQSMLPLYIADSAEWLDELVLNGADPIRESNNLSSPLTYQFGLRYEIKQTLNGVNISRASVQAELKKHPSKDLKAELKNQAAALNADAEKLKLELENNATLINAHIGAIVLRKPDADASEFPDISHSVRFQQTWNACKQEVKKMQQTTLTENCTVHDFLTKDLQTLPDLSNKTLKSIVTQFPHFEPLLRRQNDIASNYNLVRGLAENTNILEQNNHEERLMPNNVNTKPKFIAELKHKRQEQTQKQHKQETAAYEELVNNNSLSSSSTGSLLYADLDLESSKNVFLGKPTEEMTEYAEVLMHSKFIKQANQLQEKLQSNFKEIEKLETKIKDGFKDADFKFLTEIKKELVSANKEKHNLQSELKEIRQPLRHEFDQNFEHEQKKITALEEQIKNAHGNEYVQLTAKLFRTRDAYIGLIQKNQEFEQCIANSSKDALKSQAEARVLLLHQQELSLQVEIEKILQKEKEIIEKNLENTLALPKETAAFKDYHQQYNKTIKKLVTCKERISELNHILPKNTKLNDQQASEAVEENIFSVSEENPFYNTPQSNAGQVSTNISIREESSEAPAVNCGVKLDSEVNHTVKLISRLAGSSLFSLPNAGAGQEHEFKVKNQFRWGYAS